MLLPRLMTLLGMEKKRIITWSSGAGDGTCPFGAGDGTLELKELE